MRTTFERSKLRPAADGSVVSIGVFDGVHRGHQAILARNVERARELGAEPTIVTFRRHPKQLLLGRAPKTLTTLEHRLELFRRAGIEHAVALTFDETLRAMPPAEFARRFLDEGLGARELILGFDSKFGRDREGTPEFLAAAGYQVEVTPKVMVDARAVSSTAIREAVELGDLPGAAAMLGRPVSVFGRVVQGERIGRTIGFPTANLDLHHELHPPIGVYACRARVTPEGVEEPDAGPSGVSSPAGVVPGHPAVVNIGFRPTVDGQPPPAPRVEVHLLDFEGDLYGRRMEIEFCERLRGEERFPDLEALRTQIRADADRARELLGAGSS